MSPETKIPTRDRLLNAAEELVNAKGFAATSIDQILARVGMSKGTFFYHFKTKDELARALIDRFAASDEQVLVSSMERAEKLSDDPRQQLFIFVGLMIEIAEQLDNQAQPNCLFATYCWENGLFDPETQSVIENALLNWRRMLGHKLRTVAQAHPPKVDVDLDSLADMITVVFEGAFVLARTVDGKDTIAEQTRHYRNYLQLLFSDEGNHTFPSTSTD